MSEVIPLQTLRNQIEVRDTFCESHIYFFSRKDLWILQDILFCPFTKD